MVLSGIKKNRTRGQTNYIQLAVAVSQKIWTGGEKLATLSEGVKKKAFAFRFEQIFYST